MTTTTMTVLETERLILRRITQGDAEFYLALLNEPSWLRFIGDKGVRTLEQAHASIVNGPLAMYERHGFGLYVTALKADGTPIGMCGLIKRDGLDDVDIGYAFFPRYRGQGYALEAAAAVQAHGKSAFDLKRLVAITNPDNHGSIRLLENIGMKFEKMISLSEDKSEIRLYAYQY
ncbi:GNAT family N-acetyltransferase [Undibacterium arcticum]|uniref:GNAT family N-acetyltransferase n=2 Tax=Undibacterium arcticum TaxID=1762892 RepID=A0ABV7EZ10_9BURK